MEFVLFTGEDNDDDDDDSLSRRRKNESFKNKRNENKRSFYSFFSKCLRCVVMHLDKEQHVRKANKTI